MAGGEGRGHDAEGDHDILDHLGVVLYGVDAAGSLIFASPSVAGVLGWRPDELLGRSLESLVDAGDRAQGEILCQALRGDGAGVCEVPLRHRDGGCRWVRAASQPVLDGGQRVGARGVFTDITDLREGQGRLRLLAHAVRSVGEGFCVTGADGTIHFVSEPFAKIFGYEPDELIGQSIRILRPPDFSDELADEIAARTRDGGFRGDILNVRKDGSQVLVSLSTSLVCDETGETVGQVGVVRDVTEQRRSVEARKVSEARYRALFEASSDGVMLLEAGRFIEVNSAAAKLFGLARDQLVGATPWDLSPERQPDGRLSKEKARELVDASLAGQPQRFRWRHLRGDGVGLDVEVSLNRVDVGGVMLVQALVRDVTQQVRAEELERKRLRQLTTISRVARRIASTLDARAVQEVAVEELCAAFGYHNATLLLLDEATDRLGCQAMAGAYAAHAPRDYVQRVGEGLIGAAAASGVTVLANDVTRDPGYLGGFAWEASTRAELAVPVKLAGAVLGVLDLQETTIDAFDEVDVQTLETLADQVALSLHNARLYQRLGAELDERQRAQAALRDSEARYRDLVESASDLICTHDLSGRLLSVNEGAVRRLGYEVEEVVGRDLHEFLPQSARRAFDEYLRLIESDGTARGLVGLLTRNGERRFWEYSNTLRTEGVSEPVVRGFARDVTDRILAEAARRESEERYRLLAETAHDMIVLISPEGTIEYCNQRALDISGYDRDEVLSVRLDRLIAPEYLQGWRERWRRRLSGADEQFLYEIEFVNRHGARVPVEISSQPIRHEGRLEAVLVVARDITERRRAEEAVRSERDRARQYLSIAPVLFVALDQDGRVTVANQRACEVLGRSEDEIVGADWFGEFLPTSVRGGMRVAFAQLMAGDLGPFEYWENPLVTASGEERLIAWRNSLLRDRDGVLIGALSAGEDITERRQLEEQLRHAQKLEAMGRLAGGVAHDFNNLLQAMLATVQLLRFSDADAARVAESAGELEDHVRRGASLARQLLLFAKRGVTQPERLDLNELIAGSLVLLRRLMRENVRVSVIPEGAPLPVDGDRGQLEQVLANLTVNAVDAMPSGGEVTLRTGRGEANEVWFEVADTGHGMDEAVLGRIFEPFFTTKEVGKGTGLGLAVVHGIVAQHRGRIEVDSTPDLGSRFRVVLPRHDSGVFASVTGDAPAARELARGHGERILLVEDDEQIRTAFSSVLESLGYEVVALENGEGVDRLPHAPAFDLLVSDFMLPGISGVEVARHLVARWPDLRVMLMSGYARDDVLREEILAGQVQFLQKPVDLATLSQRVRATLDG